MDKILILYSTTDGHTLKICRRMQHTIEQNGPQVTVKPLIEAEAADLAAHDKVVIGASIRYGKHQPSVFRFIDAHLPLLDSKPNAFFTVNIVARKPNKNTPETNPYLRKFLRQTPWQPRQLGVFAGKLDYPRYTALDRMMIRFIMLITKGPTDPTTVVEFTDWERVDAFARTLCAMPGDTRNA